jgi:hypothetical protein
MDNKGGDGGESIRTKLSAKKGEKERGGQKEKGGKGTQRIP